MLTDEAESWSIGNSLLFKVINAHICNDEETEKKYVLYTLQIHHKSRDDSNPATIERRYTHFLELYSALSSEYPDLMAQVSFPKKALMGNFDNKLISTRSLAFEVFLKQVISDDRLRLAPPLLTFLQERELTRVKQFISNKEYHFALPLLENGFTLLSKVYKDHSPPVLLALCRLLGAMCMIPGASQTEKWADLALHRFDGVSDSDLLVLYIPLLHSCIKVWQRNGRNASELEQRLEALKMKGINCADSMTLLEALSIVELKMSE